MQCLIVDDEQLAREDMENVLAHVIPNAKRIAVGSFEEAVLVAQTEQLDVAFLDIELGEQDGIALANALKKIQPDLNLIMTTAYTQYAFAALQVYVSDYLLKPVQEEDVKRALMHLRNPVQREAKKLQVVCFGNFDVLYDGKPLRFKRAKAKELLAYLICLRGASASVGQICAVLWENDGGKFQHYFRAIVSELRRTLETCGMEKVLIHYKNVYAIDVSMIECDYYAYLDGKITKKDEKIPRFMDQYSWAEEYIYHFYGQNT